ncbi:MAG: hypothetical protein ABIH41_05275 [Nanoarchaeota archaeon]
MRHDLEARLRIKEIVNQSYVPEKTPKSLSESAFTKAMDAYGARLIYCDWNIADPPATFGPDREQYLWYHPKDQVTVEFYSMHHLDSRHTHYCVLVIGSKDSVDLPKVADRLREMLQLPAAKHR